MKKIVIIAAAFLGFASAANAQSASATATQQVNLNLTNAIAITFTGSGTSTGGAVSMPFSTVSDYTNGVTSATQQLKVQSNKNFTVTVNTNASTFTYTGSTTPAPSMPVDALNLKVTANGTGGTIAGTFGTAYTDLSATSQNLITNGTYGGNQTFSVQYQATPGFAYPAGTYTTSVVYTATQL
ncbi:MAG: hypothetical protein ACTHJ0_13400 [Flavipsychrobacter sp.]